MLKRILGGKCHRIVKQPNAINCRHPPESTGYPPPLLGSCFSLTRAILVSVLHLGLWSCCSCSCSLAFLWPRIDILPRLCRKLAQAPQQEIEKERETPSTPVSQSTRVSCARVRSLSLLLLLLLYDFFMLNALRILAGIKRGIKCPPRHPNRDQIEYQIDLVPLVIWDCHSPRLWIADAQFRIVCVYLAKG